MSVLLFGPAVAGAVTQGQPVTAALEELRSRGLRLIFSSVLVRPELTVNVDVGAAEAETPEGPARTGSSERPCVPASLPS